MASHPARIPLGLFDNPVRVVSLDELAATERERPGCTVEELSGADGTIPGPGITAYNEIHPGRPYWTDALRIMVWPQPPFPGGPGSAVLC
jgi:hypothetical protein